MELFFGWIVFTAVVVWWARTWGRSVVWAIVGALVLSPLIWAIVLLVLGRHPDKPRT